MVVSGYFSDVYSDIKSHVDMRKRDLYSCYLESQSKNDIFWLKMAFSGKSVVRKGFNDFSKAGSLLKIVVIYPYDLNLT